MHASLEAPDRTPLIAERLGHSYQYLLDTSWAAEGPISKHPEMTPYVGNKVSDRLMAQILAEEGEAGFVRVASIPRLRLGGRNGEQTITWLWEYALSQRPSGVMWTQSCETMNTYWGWWRPGTRPLASWPTHAQRIKLGLPEHPTAEEVYAVMPRPPRPALLDSLAARADVAELRPLEAEQMVKSSRFFEYAREWLVQCDPVERRHLLAWARSSMLRVRVLDATSDPSAADLRHLRSTEWNLVLKTVTNPSPLVIETAWHWVNGKVAEMEDPRCQENLTSRNPQVVQGETRQFSDMIRRLMSHPLPGETPPARAAVWKWLKSPPSSSAQAAETMRLFAWEVWSDPNILRTRDETATLVRTSTRSAEWERLVASHDVTRDERLQLMRWLKEGERTVRRTTHGVYPTEQIGGRASYEEVARRLEYLPVTDADPELFLALASISAPTQQVRMATRTENERLRQSILELVFQSPFETVTTLLKQEMNRPLLQYISPTMVRPLLLHQDREVRVWAAKMIGKASDAKQEGLSVTPRLPTHSIRKNLRRIL